MSIDAKFDRYCDECGKTMQKAHKVHLEREYCGSCYKRVFTRRPCESCSGHAIVHKNHSNVVVCFACEVGTRRCLRCEKPVPRAGILVAGKAVCPSCTPYFRTTQCCTQCGKESARVSSAPSLGIGDKVCDSCRNKVTHSTCIICRKYRKVAKTTERGIFCVDCAQDEAISHACPDCGTPVPGAGQSRCRACLNKKRIDQEVRLTRVIFRNEWTATLWSSFASWAHERDPGSPRTLSTVKSSQIFFERLEAHFCALTDISAIALLRVFSTAELRRHLLASRFVVARLGLELSAEAKRDAADADRIRAIALNAKRTPHEQIIAGYLGYLDQRDLSARTTRMYLSTAATFCKAEKVGEQAWCPGQLERYLQKNKGAKNNLTRFVTYCREVLHWDVSMPSRSQPVRSLVDPMQSVNKLTRLLRRVDAEGLDKASKQTVISILSTSLGFASATFSKLSREDLQIADSSVSLTVTNERVVLPAQLWPYARRLADLLACQD